MSEKRLYSEMGPKQELLIRKTALEAELSMLHKKYITSLDKEIREEKLKEILQSGTIVDISIKKIEDELVQIHDELDSLSRERKQWSALFEQDKFDEYFKREDEMRKKLDREFDLKKRLRELEEFMDTHPTIRQQDAKSHEDLQSQDPLLRKMEGIKLEISQIDQELESIVSSTSDTYN